MATIAIGDVHGYLAPLDDLLAAITPNIGGGDTIVFLGDIIDRGPDSKGCVDRILQFREQTPAGVVVLCGNHEQWMLRSKADPTRHSWLLGMLPFETIGSYSIDASARLRAAMAKAGSQLFGERVALPYALFFDALPSAHLQFFAELRTYYRGADGLCVHGGLDPRVPCLEEQTTDALIWGAKGFPQAYDGRELVVYGHHNNAEVDARGWPHPTIAGATIGIDTIAHGVLTAIRLEDRRVFQSAMFENAKRGED
jgi:Calcineurin-like phosphoesterase